MIRKLRQLLRDRQRLLKQVKDLQSKTKTIDKQELLSEVTRLILTHDHDSRYYTRAEADAKAKSHAINPPDQPDAA